MADEFQIQELDLEAYLARIAYAGPRSVTPESLAALHLAHATHVPFENLDILAGMSIGLDMKRLQEKLVAEGRGGYCFEQNLLFAAALERLGFKVIRLAARVRYRTTLVLPKTHMTLLVEAGGAKWLCDVGFGAEGLLMPVPFEESQVARHFAWTYRVTQDDGAWVLQSLRGGTWQDLYAFTLEPQRFADYVMANHFTSTYPESRFVKTLTVQLPTPEVRWALRGIELVEDRGETESVHALGSRQELMETLTRVFGLRLPEGSRFQFAGLPA